MPAASAKSVKLGCVAMARRAAIVVAIAAAGTAGQARADEPAPSGWREKAYEYAIMNQSVVDVLKNFGYNTGLRMAIAPSVRGTVTGRIDGHTAGAFLDALTRSNGLDWYYDGAVMYVSAAADEQTEMIRLHGSAFGQIKSSMARLGLVDQRYTFSAGSSPDVAIVAGPPSYVAAIKRAIEALAISNPDSLTIYRGSQPQVVKFP
jgi:type II secretory pathway component GspD/PulD (secretin)